MGISDRHIGVNELNMPIFFAVSDLTLLPEVSPLSNVRGRNVWVQEHL